MGVKFPRSFPFTLIIGIIMHRRIDYLLGQINDCCGREQYKIDTDRDGWYVLFKDSEEIEQGYDLHIIPLMERIATDEGLDLFIPDEPVKPTIAAWCIQAPKMPTFYLMPDVQGILTQEHAVKIGRQILGEDYERTGVIYAVKVELVDNTHS